MIAGAIAASLWLAGQLASGEYAWPAIAFVVALSASVVVAFRVPFDVIVISTLLFGYFVGNRGFAQLMPAPSLPLLPAEIGLSLAGAWLLLQSAHQRTLPMRRDAINLLVLAWIVVGTIRVIFDVQHFGFVALRDYAMSYYAGFFFITQNIGGERPQRFLLLTLTAASVAQPIAALLTEVFPAFFLYIFTFRGVPLIYFKGDLALTFMAVSGLLLFSLTRGVHRLWAWPLATLEIAYVITGANRASMLGALVALAWIARSRVRWFAWVQGAVVAAAFLLVAGLALLTENGWARQKFESTLERLASITDFAGRGTYVTEESGMKGDNNRFRAVWWRIVIQDTLDQNPVFGLGFGYDLAERFVQEYSPEAADDFNARSPHSIIVSAFGRTGLLGLLVFVALTGAIAVRTWRLVCRPDADLTALGLWASVWVILVSACFGVVLEGPMGAVLFWNLLGLATAITARSKEPEAPLAAESDNDEALPAKEPAVQLSPLHYPAL